MAATPSIFTTKQYQFPYLYKFPGQASDERILFITRESEMVLYFRQLVVGLAAIGILLAGIGLAQVTAGVIGAAVAGILELLTLGGAVLFGMVGYWWVTTIWQKSVALVTNKRLTKFIYTTPWNRHNLSLPLDMIVDTGAYSKGVLQAIFRLGSFTARSSAASSGVATDDPGRVNKKYFYIENIAHAEDLHHYLHKVLFVFRQDWQQLANYRPFLPHLKGDARKEFMQQYPEYWS